MNQQKEDDYILYERAALLLGGKSAATIARYVKQGKLTRYVRQGRNYVRRSEVEKLDEYKKK